MKRLTDVSELLRSLEPQLRPGEFVYVSGDHLPAEVSPESTVRESEGLSAVITRAEADEHGLSYDFVGAWITLAVYSALDAVGLTAAVSDALGRHGISCNMIAGLHHDHLIVPIDRADDALTILRRLAAQPPRRR